MARIAQYSVSIIITLAVLISGCSCASSDADDRPQRNVEEDSRHGRVEDDPTDDPLDEGDSTIKDDGSSNEDSGAGKVVETDDGDSPGAVGDPTDKDSGDEAKIEDNLSVSGDVPEQVETELDKPEQDNPVEEGVAVRDTVGRAVVEYPASGDATQAIQAAIDQRLPHVVIPNTGKKWIVEPITLRSHLNLTLEEGVVLEAKRGSFRGKKDSIFLAREVENITISGDGATIRMHKKDYRRGGYEKSEWRHGIALYGARNITIKDLRIENTGGDAIYVGCTWDKRRIPCKDIVITNCKLHQNLRQGISIVSASNIVVDGCEITQTSGAAPQAAIDVEPSHYRDLMDRIVVKNCTAIDNAGSGFMVNVSRQSHKSTPMSIVFDNCEVSGSVQPGLRAIMREDQGATGYIKYLNCRTSNTTYAGTYLAWDHASKIALSFEDCHWSETASRAGHSPIMFEFTNKSSASGGAPIKFTGEIVDSGTQDIVKLKHRRGTPVENVVGTLRVKGRGAGEAVVLPETPGLSVEFVN